MKLISSAAKLIAATVVAAILCANAAWAGQKGVGTNPGAWLPAAVNNLNVTWWYNWTGNKNGASGNGEYIPMVWGANDVNSTELNSIGNSGASAILTFNEPDNASQSNLTVAQALSLWPQIQAVAQAHHMRIGSPAAVGWQPGGWLDQFLQGCRAKGYEVDFICMHPYPGDADPTAATSDMQNMLTQAHNYYGLPIWVTEFAMANWGNAGDPYFGQATEAQFATKAVPMLNSLSFVERYAWLAAIPNIGGYTDTATCDSSGNNTQVGVAYAGAGGSIGTVSNGIHTLTPQCAPSARLDDSGGGTTNGNKIQIWAAASTADQQWSFSNIGGNNYNIAVNLGPYCLDSNGGAAGTAVHLWSCGGYANQQWTVNSVSGGYQLVNSAGNCLDDTNYGTNNGNTVQNWTCGGNSAQTWMLDYTAPSISNGVHTLTPQCATGSRLDDSNGGTANGNTIQIWQAAGNVNQQWSFSNIGGNTYNIAVNLGPYCLDANGGASGTAVHLWSCGGYDNQKWTAITASGGFEFQNPAGTCLDVTGANSANGTVVQSYTCSSNDNAQIWAVN